MISKFIIHEDQITNIINHLNQEYDKLVFFNHLKNNPHPQIDIRTLDEDDQDVLVQCLDDVSNNVTNIGLVELRLLERAQFLARYLVQQTHLDKDIHDLETDRIARDIINDSTEWIINHIYCPEVALPLIQVIKQRRD